VEVSLALSAAVVLAVALGALAQSVSGIGFSLVCGPLLVAALGAADGVRLGVVLSLGLNVVLLARHRRDLDRGGALRLLVPTALTVPMFAVLLRDVQERPAAALAGGTIVVLTLLLAAGVRWRAARGSVGAAVTGVVAAATTVVASVAGPPVALWAANAGWSADVQRATLQAYFLGVNVVALASLGPPDVPLRLLAGCVAALAAGLAVGGPVARRVSEPAARRTTLALAGAGGAVVLLRAALG
jgi:uncharacterized membrane protein YfcA